MGNLDRLLEALARQLPSSADRTSIIAALHEAAKALPENQAKTRKRLASKEEACVEKLEALMKELATEVHEDAASEASAEAQGDPDVAAYAGISGDDPAACMARCAELVQAALAGLRPAKLAEEAFEGLLAVLPSGKIAIELETLVHWMQLLPTASAALAGSESPAWCHFLGFLLTSLARLKGIESSGSAQKDAKDVAARLGGLIALLSGRASARAALRHGLSALDGVPGPDAMARLASAVLPIVGVAFGSPNTWEDGAVVRSDLVAVVHALRFVGLCRKAGAGEMHALNEASDFLRLALERHFPVAILSSKLESMGLSDSKRRRLSKGMTKANSRAASAQIVSEAIIRASATLGAANIAQIANSAGLPMGEDEAASDRKAASARAKGDLFFEDVSGNDLMETSAQMAANVLVQLDGVEDLNTPSKKKRKRAKSAAEEVDNKVEAEAA